jgi:hypothetical protein
MTNAPDVYHAATIQLEKLPAATRPSTHRAPVSDSARRSLQLDHQSPIELLLRVSSMAILLHLLGEWLWLFDVLVDQPHLQLHFQACGLPLCPSVKQGRIGVIGLASLVSFCHTAFWIECLMGTMYRAQALASAET